MGAKQIKVVIVDDHPVILHGVESFCNKSEVIEVVATASDYRSALEAAEKWKPDVLVLDITMGNLSGLDILTEITKATPTTSVIIYTTHNIRSYFHRAIQRGAKGYALKSDPLAKLVEGIQQVYNGGLYLSSNLPGDVLMKLVQNSDEQREEIDTLTSREMEIANLLAQAKSTNEIGEILFISPKTVRVHRGNIMKKLSCKNQNDLILRLIELFPQQ